MPAISVFDLFKKVHVYESPIYKKRLGLPEDVNGGREGFEHLMHPEDLLIATEAVGLVYGGQNTLGSTFSKTPPGAKKKRMK